MLDKINCCTVALTLGISNVISLAIFAGYTLRVKDKNIELEKQEKKHDNRIKELEQKNGKELKRIEGVEQKNEQLQQEVQELKKKLNNHEKSPN